MTFLKIYKILENSFSYIEFMITYNELIPEILEQKKINIEGWKIFMIYKNNLKKNFKKGFEQENDKNQIVNMLNEINLVYGFNGNELNKILNEKFNYDIHLFLKLLTQKNV